MTIEIYSHAQRAIKIPVRRASVPPIGLLDLADQMRADAQLHHALQVPGTALLGLATDGVPLMIRLASPDVTHVLISGARGSGKTRLAATMLASLALFQKPREIQLVVLSEQLAAFDFLRTLPHLHGMLASDAEQCLRQLRWLEAEMERREREFTARPRLIVVAGDMREWNAENVREYRVRLARVAQRGRQAGISLVLCQEQAWQHDALRQDYFPVRLVARAANDKHSLFRARGMFDLLAGSERVPFQPALFEPDENYFARVRMNLEPRRQARASGLGKFFKRFERAQNREDGIA